MKRVWEREVYDVQIEWSKPISYQDALDKNLDIQIDYFFYKIVGQFGKKYSLFYIGKVYDQYVSKRLKNKDHKDKRAEWEVDHPRSKLCVSFGQLKSEQFDEKTDKWKRQIVDDIESLLIYSHSDHLKLKNSKSVSSHSVLLEYDLRNTGFVTDGMLKNLFYGLFFKDRRY